MSQGYVRSDSVVARRIGGETLVVPVCGGVGDLASIFSLNEIGSLIWQNLENPQTQDSLVTLIASEYEVDAARATADVCSYLHELETAGLVQRTAVAD